MNSTLLRIPLMLAAALAIYTAPKAAADGKKALSDEWPKDSFYKTYPQFHPFPDEHSTKPQTVYRFGPVGIGVELTMPAFGMKVKNVEEGSPAATGGKIKAGQIIESINGLPLKEIDPRVFLGNIITKAEASDGKVKFMLKDKPDAKAEEVLVQIPVLGAYSKTWPLNCPKSGKIVRGVAEYVAKTTNAMSSISTDQAMMFMLSTGDEKDLEVVRGWVKEIVAKTKDTDGNGMIPWHIGYGMSGLCEYYLRTGDESVLPLIEKGAKQLARLMYNGAWNHRTIVNFKYGHMNAAGVQCVKFLLLAKECGVEVDDYTLQTSLRHFFRFTGRGNVAYGDALPEGGFVDNGKTGGLAFVMAAAVSLTPEGEKSVYAKARDISATKSFYSTSWMLHGHTGGGIGEIWRSTAIGLMYDKKPTKYREFMDGRTWHYDLSRRYNGAMTILADGDYSRGYDKENWGIGYAMTYTIPRKTLRVTGAPPSKYSKKFTLPQRPWGTAADDAFYSLTPAPDKNGKVQNVDEEKLVSDASWPILRKVNAPNATDELLLMYARHPDYGVRGMAALAIREKGRDALILELLKDKDPRVRQAGVMVICNDGNASGHIPAERLTPEMVAILTKMIADPAESWWCVENAMLAISIAKPEQIVPQVDTLIGWLKHEEWWMQRAAMAALAPVAANPEVAKKIMPVIANLAAKNTVGGAMAELDKIVKALVAAPPEVKKLGAESFASAYAAFPTKLKAPGGADMKAAMPYLQGGLASAIVAFPGGFDQLYSISRKIMPDEALPYKNLYFNADSKKFGPDLAKAMPSIVVDDVVPEYNADHLDALIDESRWFSAQEKKKSGQFAVGDLDGLAAFYEEIGIHDYNWHNFGPARDAIKWDYLSYTPAKALDKNNNPKAVEAEFQYAGNKAEKAEAEAAKLEAAATKAEAAAASSANAKKTADDLRAKASAAAEKAKQARNLANTGFTAGSLPPAAANWYATSFEPQKAGWKNGLAPFANVNGKLAAAGACRSAFCGCGQKPKTLWESDILLMRTTLELPPLNKDCRYRLLIGGNVHSKDGNTVLVYLNGKPVHQQGGFGGRLRAMPRGFFIDMEMAKEFKSGKLQIAVAAAKAEKAYIAVWLEEMKMPPLEDKDLAKARARVPMLCAEWQEMQDPDSKEKVTDPNEGKYRFNGKFADNPRLRGDWTAVDLVDAPADFVPGKPKNPGKAPLKTLALSAEGKTADPKCIWSGNMLIALEKREALEMTLKTIGGKDYLFVESGGFSDKNPKGWETQLSVLEKTKK